MTIPPEDWTWDDYAAFVRELAGKLPEGTYAAGNLGFAMDGFTNFVQGRGESLFNADGTVGVSEQTIVDYFTFWDALRQEGVTEPADVMSEIPDNIIDDTLLANGRILVDARPANQLDSHQKILDVAKPGETFVLHRYPVGPAGPGRRHRLERPQRSARTATRTRSRSLPPGRTSSSRTSARPNIYRSDNGVVTVDSFREQQLANPEATPGQRQLIEVFNEVAPEARSAFFPAGGYAAILEALTPAYESVAFERATPEEAAAAMLDQVERLMR